MKRATKLSTDSTDAVVILPNESAKRWSKSLLGKLASSCSTNTSKPASTLFAVVPKILLYKHAVITCRSLLEQTCKEYIEIHSSDTQGGCKALSGDQFSESHVLRHASVCPVLKGCWYQDADEFSCRLVSTRTCQKLSTRRGLLRTKILSLWQTVYTPWRSCCALECYAI